MHSAQYTHCDPAVLLETVGYDQGIFLQLVEIFARESKDKIDKISHAAIAGDISQLGFESHALKGTVGPLNADALIQMLQLIEEECKSGQCQVTANRLSILRQELDAIKREVQHFIAHLEA